MDVDTSEAREMQNFRRKDHAIGGNDNDVGLPLLQDRHAFSMPKGLRLEDRNSVLLCTDFDRRRSELHMASAGFVLHCKDPND